jgi:succinate-semialdehyde dehydrogenase/glutarate-semialdehyde dehydrogenase
MAEATQGPLSRLGVEPGLFIDGRWREGAGPGHTVRNPATGAELAGLALASAADFADAIDGAERAFGRWRLEPHAARGDVLKRAAAVLTKRRQDVAELLTLEQGKPLSQALGEVDYAASFFQWFGEEARRPLGRIQPHPMAGREYRVTREPAGVAGLVTPWNFPLAQGSKKIAAALAAGCTAVWKPSELTPLVALALAALLREAGLPDGALQVLPAPGPLAGEALTGDARVRVISVTGSTATGRAVMRAATRHLPRLSLELGGNAPFIILPDADLDEVVPDLIKLKLLCAGQVCVTANRVFVPEALELALVERLLPAWRALRVGNGLAAGTDVGPLIHNAACARVRSLVDAALSDGAELVCENRSHEADPVHAGGSYLAPAILRGVTDAMALAREEVFGPVMPVLVYKKLDEAVRRANATEAGLSAYVYGRDLSLANAVAGRLEAGIVGVNEWRPLRAEIPFGGMKASGQGWEGGEEGLLEFCELKVVATPRPGPGA